MTPSVSARLATHADGPVVHREWLRPGTHVNSVGYNALGTGEVDRATVTDAYVVVESRAAAFAPPPAGAVELLDVIDADDASEITEASLMEEFHPKQEQKSAFQRPKRPGRK